MSDKPVATIVCGVLAFPAMIICCAIGPVAFVALLSGTVSAGFFSVFGENYFGNMFLTGTLIALVALLARAWQKRKSAEATLKLENTYER